MSDLKKLINALYALLFFRFCVPIGQVLLGLDYKEILLVEFFT